MDVILKVKKVQASTMYGEFKVPLEEYQSKEVELLNLYTKVDLKLKDKRALMDTIRWNILYSCGSIDKMDWLIKLLKSI